jgi:hypothetical protein
VSEIERRYNLASLGQIGSEAVVEVSARRMMASPNLTTKQEHLVSEQPQFCDLYENFFEFDLIVTK